MGYTFLVAIMRYCISRLGYIALLATDRTESLGYTVHMAIDRLARFAWVTPML
jgi:hypothetical protein